MQVDILTYLVTAQFSISALTYVSALQVLKRGLHKLSVSGLARATAAVTRLQLGTEDGEGWDSPESKPLLAARTEFLDWAAHAFATALPLPRTQSENESLMAYVDMSQPAEVPPGSSLSVVRADHALALMVMSFGAVQHMPGKAWLAGASAQLVPWMKHMDTTLLSQTLSAFHVMSWVPSKDLLKELVMLTADYHREPKPVSLVIFMGKRVCPMLLCRFGLARLLWSYLHCFDRRVPLCLNVLGHAKWACSAFSSTAGCACACLFRVRERLGKSLSRSKLC